MAPPSQADDGRARGMQHVDTLEKEEKEKERKADLDSTMNLLSIYVP